MQAPRRWRLPAGSGLAASGANRAEADLRCSSAEPPSSTLSGPSPTAHQGPVSGAKKASPLVIRDRRLCVRPYCQDASPGSQRTAFRFLSLSNGIRTFGPERGGQTAVEVLLSVCFRPIPIRKARRRNVRSWGRRHAPPLPLGACSPDGGRRSAEEALPRQPSQPKAAASARSPAGAAAARGARAGSHWLAPQPGEPGWAGC